MLARQLADDFTVYSVDLPNHGNSFHADKMNLGQMADAIQHWMDAVALSSAHFFGHSLGGKVAMELALKSPHCVDKLVVADMAPVEYAPRHDAIFAGLLSLDPATLTSRAQANALLEKHVPEPGVRSFLLKNLRKTDSANFRWQMHLAGIHASYPALIKQNRQARFAGPTLFLKAEHSDYIVADYRGDISSRFPHAEFKQVGNTGHWLHAEKPELVAKLVARFLFN